ncbi:hypothetical protein ACNO8X_26725 [Mycobacterium sp. PDNC021]|uniref:hypothetical protein n=1 Tax=Mycobacterium sp. PDNC021 TaxID=3391399 RepID=UPI003AAC7F26
MVEMPTRTKVESWKSNHLASAADAWTRQAHTVEDIYSSAQQAVTEPTWHGSAADSAHDRMFSDIVRVRTAMELLRKAAGIAKSGADLLAGLKRSAIEAISNAERQFFSVSDNLRVTDRIPKILVGPLLMIRDLARAAMEADIRGKALSLAAADQEIASQLKPIATSLREFKTDQPGGPAGPGASGDPKITGPAGPLTKDDDKADLNATIPGTGIVISGDGRNGYPTLNGERNPLDVGNPRDKGDPLGKDVVRPLPTGTAAGPEGKQYAMYGVVPYARTPEEGYAAADTTVVDLADPSKSIGVLRGISQASAAYDPKTNRMYVVGNPDPLSRQRILYQSAPIDPAHPNDWVNTVQPIGPINGLPGDRENQLVVLKGGGFMLVGSDAYNDPTRHAVSAVTAATPQGLLNATPTDLFPPSQHNWPGGAAPYGPTVVDTTYDPVTGKENVEIRVSTWEAKPGWVPTPEHPRPDYNPNTYKSNVTVQH